ncbi:hypothetical protein RJT34_07497 [Clitoria ternatea]|uniref:DUF4218 domain-containing protein n=1 Tax=Clitoria ternatea TaxID=43366 RepID=A0AAN9K5D5_CLITE
MMVETKVGLARFEAARSSRPFLRTITASKCHEQAPVKLGRILQGPDFEALVTVAWNEVYSIDVVECNGEMLVVLLSEFLESASLRVWKYDEAKRAEEAKLGGPVHYRWMYPIEREFREVLRRQLRRRVRNATDVDKKVHKEFVSWFTRRIFQDVNNISESDKNVLLCLAQVPPTPVVPPIPVVPPTSLVPSTPIVPPTSLVPPIPIVPPTPLVPPIPVVPPTSLVPPIPIATIRLSAAVKQEEFFSVFSKIVFGLDEKDRQLRYPLDQRLKNQGNHANSYDVMFSFHDQR